MATVDDDDVLDDDQLDVLLNFPPDIQEVIEQVFWVNIYLVEKNHFLCNKHENLQN